jgi:hypothetical protein
MRDIWISAQTPGAWQGSQALDHRKLHHCHSQALFNMSTS